MPVTHNKNFVSTPRKLVFIALPLLCAIGLTALGFVHSSTKRSVVALNDSSRPEAPVTLHSVSPSQRPSVELITLEPTGFEPDQLARPAGEFLLGVNNRSGLSDLTFWLVNESGASQGQKRMVKEKVWRQVVDLPPGHYLLGVTGHPNWRCQITIISAQ